MTAPDVERRTEPEETTGGALFWIGAVVGIGVMAFGVKGLLDAAPSTQPSQVGLSLIGLDLLHDAIVAPLVCLVGMRPHAVPSRPHAGTGARRAVRLGDGDPRRMGRAPRLRP